MMKLLKKVIVCLAIMFGSSVAVVTDATPVSAYLTSCSHGFGGGSASSICWNHANNGGNNLQRAVVYCTQPSGVNFVRYGYWVLEDTYSTAYCPQWTYAYASSYQLI